MTESERIAAVKEEIRRKAAADREHSVANASKQNATEVDTRTRNVQISLEELENMLANVLSSTSSPPPIRKTLLIRQALLKGWTSREKPQ